MRSVDDALAYVHREARRRQIRNQLALGAGAAVVAAAVLILLVVGIVSVEPTTELSVDASTRVRDGSSSTPTSSNTRAADAASPSESGRPPEPTSDVVGDRPTTASTAAPRPAASRRPANGPARPAPTSGPGPGDPGPEVVASTNPSPPPSDRASSTTVATGPTGVTTTTTGPPVCTDQDFGATDIVWASGPSGQPYPEHTAPAVEPTWFVVSVWAREGTPCVTRSWGQELTVTDATGAVVARHRLDDGPGRLTEPGRWVLYDGWFRWDPACVESPPAGWTTPVCTSVGAGSYTAQIVVAGAALPPLTVTIAVP